MIRYILGDEYGLLVRCHFHLGPYKELDDSSPLSVESPPS